MTTKHPSPLVELDDAKWCVILVEQSQAGDRTAEINNQDYTPQTRGTGKTRFCQPNIKRFVPECSRELETLDAVGKSSPYRAHRPSGLRRFTVTFECSASRQGSEGLVHAGSVAERYQEVESPVRVVPQATASSVGNDKK
ncbi:hypothetical protein PM082_022579 [Marasmius tenuissimus]|nr:hypothetical protein PM082_022579 [Marasmius tenuissimus]